MNKTITALAIMMASFAANASVLPETPVPFKSGTGAIDNDTVYIASAQVGARDRVRRAYRIISPINTSGILIVVCTTTLRQRENAKE